MSPPRLDEKSGREVVTLFQELAREQKVTIVMVTHDNRILDVADRVVNMVDGRIKSDVVVREAIDLRVHSKAARVPRPDAVDVAADRRQDVGRARPGRVDVISQQGDPGDKFYLVRHGEVGGNHRGER